MKMDNYSLPFSEGDWMQEGEYLKEDQHNQENVVKTKAQLINFKGKDQNPPQMDKTNGYKNIPIVPSTSRTISLRTNTINTTSFPQKTSEVESYERMYYNIVDDLTKL
jgi:hypothetical protein